MSKAHARVEREGRRDGALAFVLSHSPPTRSVFEATAHIGHVLANASSVCPVILLTAIYYSKTRTLLSSADKPHSCAIAFVNAPIHATPGWTMKTAMPFPGDLPRSAHAVKIAAGLENGNSTIVYVDLKLAEKFSVSASGCAALCQPDVDVAVTRHPDHDNRTVDEEILQTIYWMSYRKMPIEVFEDLIKQRKFMASAGYDMNVTGILPDTYFLIWKPTAYAHSFALAWLTEVGLRSMREQTNFDYALKFARPSARVQWVDYKLPATCLRRVKKSRWM